jgi:hypothetical protein
MALAMKVDRPTLLHARTSAPVILSLAQPGGGAGAPQAFPSGAEFHALVNPGEPILRLYAPMTARSPARSS